MANNSTPSTQNNSDEIDLGKLFQLIGRGFNAVFNFILKVFLYVKKNIFILMGLVVVGLAIGIALNRIISKKLKSEIIVKPQLESKNYLYDVIGEIKANLKAKDTLFFKGIGIEKIDFNGLDIEINRVLQEGGSENDIKYLELLQSFENTDAIADIVRAELQNKSSFNHRITIYYKNAEFGKVFTEKILEYINTNNYFNVLLEVYRNNATYRIEENQALLKQVDEIISNYTNNLASKNSEVTNERIILDNQEQVNIADIFQYKTGLIRDIEAKKLELIENKETLSVVNLGQPQVVQKSFFGKNIVLIPLLLILLFFAISILKYLNRRSMSIS
ncbi:hypothetical protein [Maribacter hydrothermalis]|uniref:Chain length determinant protein n=1 Tax=Maribacter hydrothermalis TaxID=1836467 RepID=A0A1B7ZE39_9FLAO|nr:hypothetical protein [Maribacter hydrothermalis]APQ17345.1 hypothetical protein BTR34_08430 [Maribacter hydrothermalis]OBR41823.1 hypothetical protein A9200_00080 [Maribacter hydrothermalis]